MKILHLIDSEGIYGAEQILLALAEEQTRLGMKAVVGAIRTRSERDRTLELAAEERGISAVTFEMGWGMSWKRTRTMFEFASREGVSVIHSHSYKSNIVCGLARPGPTPALMTTLHGWTAPHRLKKLWFYEWLDRQLLTRHDAVVSVSNELARRFHLPRSVQRQLRVIHNGLPARSEGTEGSGSSEPFLVELERFCARGFTVGAVGRLSKEKGLDVLVRTLAILRQRGLHVQLAIVGDGPEKAALVDQIREAKLENLVHFTGYIANAARCMPYFQAYVLPSRTEGLPVVLLEAARAERPIVATRVGGVPELIVDNQCGLLCDPDQPEVLADLIGTVSRDPALAARLGRAARKAMENGFSVEAMAREYKAVYESIVNGRGR